MAEWTPKVVALDIDGTLLKWVDGQTEHYETITPEVYAAVLEHHPEALVAVEERGVGGYRVIDTAAGDLGLSASRKFDCEAWIPTRQGWGELTSTSNCTDFQSRRLDIRTREDGQTVPVATLNGTLTAITRTIVAILETHQNEDGSVTVPQALRPYLGGLEVLKTLD